MDEKPQKFIIDVAVLTRIPMTRQQFFSYVHHEPIPAGSLVSVPLFRRTLPGIVLGSRSDFHRLGNFELKKVQSVLVENFLTEKQLQFAENLSTYYFCPLGIMLKQFTPKRVKARGGEQRTASSEQYKKIQLTSEQENAAATIAANDCTFLLHGPSASGKTEVYFEAIERIFKNDTEAQALILLPELMLAEDILNRASLRFGRDKIAYLHSDIADGKYFQDWERIRSGEAKIVIGTRMAVFAPFKKLGLIVVDEEQDISHKQWDMNPRYDARTAAEMLSEIHSSPLVYVSATPRIETYYKTKIRTYDLLKLSRLSIPNTKYQIPDTKIELIDMRKERWKDFSGKRTPNYSCISRALENGIMSALSQKQQVILFVNHQGMNSFSVCAECKEVLRCPKCQRTLIYDSSGVYRCLHCNYVSDAFPICTKCKSTVFRNVGIGTQAVEKEMRRRFPSIRVARADTQSMKKSGAQKELFEKFSKGEIDILIGTQMITKGWDNPKVSVVGIIDADALLTIPDFATDERAFAHIMQAIGRAGRPGSVWGRAYIQTFDPLNPLFIAAEHGSYEEFYEMEIQKRQDLKLPPFGKYIRLVFQNSNHATLEKDARMGYDKLIKGLGNDADHVRILGPNEPLLSKVRTTYRRQILLHWRQNSENSPQNILKALAQMPPRTIIDVDPIQTI